MRTYAWMVILGNQGPITALLSWLGWDPAPKLLFTTFSATLAMTHALIPFMTMSLFSVMKRIDPLYIRAAENLGASPLRAFLAVYLPLEEFLLKWVPLGATGVAVLRLGNEAPLYSALGAVAVAYKLRGLALPSTPVDRPLAAFAAVALVSLALSGGSWLAGIVNLRVLLRYAAAYYLAVYLALGPHEQRRLLRQS